jgi:hypothetical protein
MAELIDYKLPLKNVLAKPQKVQGASAHRWMVTLPVVAFYLRLT